MVEARKNRLSLLLFLPPFPRRDLSRALVALSVVVRPPTHPNRTGPIWCEHLILIKPTTPNPTLRGTPSLPVPPPPKQRQQSPAVRAGNPQLHIITVKFPLSRRSTNGLTTEKAPLELGAFIIYALWNGPMTPIYFPWNPFPQQQCTGTPMSHPPLRNLSYRLKSLPLKPKWLPSSFLPRNPETPLRVTRINMILMTEASTQS